MSLATSNGEEGKRKKKGTKKVGPLLPTCFFFFFFFSSFLQRVWVLMSYHDEAAGVCSHRQDELSGGPDGLSGVGGTVPRPPYT